jgi:NADH dehydrogenase (ubiquinone) 1 alpha subcomplex subunit 10
MALGICRFRSGILLSRLSNAVDGQSAVVVAGGCVRMQVANLTATYGGKYPYPEPFPYQRKRYNMLTALSETTASRFNDNTKVIVVEGNLAVGKKEFAQRLAKEFDLKYFPPTPEINCFLDKSYKFDIRSLDPVLPPGAKTYDLKKLYSDHHPQHGTIGRLQLRWYEEKFYDYLAALKHLLSTGQGVVLVRSVYSDSVFVEALHSMGWLTSSFVRYYNMIRSNSICDLYRPHLTIYLDTPLQTVRDRIAKRNNPIEVGSRNLTDEYLKTVDQVYQQRFLPKMRESGEVVEIDWSEVANDDDMEAIAEELQLLKLEGEDNDDPKFTDWSRQDEDDWSKFRLLLENENTWIPYFTRDAPWDCPEIMLSPSDQEAWNQVARRHPVFKHRAGWSSELGHSTLFKL